MNHDHIADRAELYALGALDPGENATIETHLRQCSSCARIVGSAERDVALIASRESRRNAPPELAGRIERTLEVNQSEPLLRAGRHAWRLPAALAAALLIGLLPSAYFWSEYRTLHGAMLAQNSAMERLASAAHRTSTFQATPGTSRAEVMYGTDGTWYLVVVRDPSRPLAVAWMHDGERTMLGSAIPRGNLAMLYLPKKPSHGSTRAHGWRSDRCSGDSFVAKNRSKSSRRSIRVAGGSAERIVAP